MNSKLKNFLQEIDYDTLNNLINYESKQFYFCYIDEIDKLARILFDSIKDMKLDKNDYTFNILPSESISYAEKFFMDINPQYASQFLNILREQKLENNNHSSYYSVNFKFDEFISNEKNTKYAKNRDVCYSDGFIDIVIKRNIHDIFIIVHEMIHKFTQSVKQSELRLLLCEIPSLAFEFILYDFLKNVESSNREFQKDLKTYITNRISSTVNIAINVLIECELFRLFKKNNNHLDADIIYDYLNTLDRNNPLNAVIKSCLIKKLKVIVLKEHLNYSHGIRYIIGLLYACDFRVRIEDNSNELDTLFKLNHSLSHSDYEIKENVDRIRAAGITILSELPSEKDFNDILRDSNFFFVDEQTMIRLTSHYKKVVNEFFGKRLLFRANKKM